MVGKDIETHITEVILMEFNWRWKKYLKGHQTQQQFSTDFRKFLKLFANQKETAEVKDEI